jgi:nucleoside phosphorylase
MSDGQSEIVDFVIVTALEEERDALHALLPDLRRLDPSEHDTRVYFGCDLPVTFPGGRSGTYRVATLSLAKMGRVNAATATADAIRRWRPRFVLLVGIAGGLNARGVSLGDVLVSDQVVDYELQKLRPDGPEVRYQVHRADQRLLEAAANFPDPGWADIATPRPSPDGRPKRQIGPIATGDKVDAAGVVNRYRGAWPELSGIEMESGGAATAAFQSALRPGFFMVRGVSDLADADKDSVSVGRWRQYACAVAAYYAVALLRSGPVPLLNSGPDQGPDIGRRTETWLTRGLDWLNAVASQHKVKLGVYLALIVAFWTALVAFPKSLDPLLPGFPEGQEWKRNWLAIGVGLGVPTVILLVREGLPALWQWRRDRRLARWVIGTPTLGYFRLTPYERQDRDRFRRADQAQDEVLAWLRAEGPTILYLSGRSGSGKSSLLNASVLPGLEGGDPPFLTLTLRTLGDPVGDLSAALRRPGVVYKQPPNDLPTETLPLLRRVDDRLADQDQRLLVMIDQFEDILVFLDREPEPRQEELRQWLSSLSREPLRRIRFLLVMRFEYLGDLSRIGLPRPELDRNWKQVEPFTEAEAREFLRGGFGEQGLGTELIEAVVHHASELDEVRGKVRPVVLNMIGLALAARSGRAGRVLNPREAQRLMFDHVREGLKDPLARDHAPGVLSKMINPAGTREPPASAGDLAGRTGLDVPLVQGCLNRLSSLGFVRSFDSDRERTAGTQVWEVSHDYVARLLSLVLPGWKPSPWSRLRRAFGPVLMVLGIAGVFGLVEYKNSADRRRLEGIRELQRWAGQFDITTRYLDDETFLVKFIAATGDSSEVARAHSSAMRAVSSKFAHLISRLDLTGNGLTSLPPEIRRLTHLRILDLTHNELPDLPPEIGELTELTSLNVMSNRLKSLPHEIAGLVRLNSLGLSFNRVTTLPAEVAGLVRLKSLDLSHNEMKALPPEVGLLTSLESLTLYYNHLTTLPPDIAGLVRLKSLDLGDNEIKALPPEVTCLTSLKSLGLISNGLQTLPAEVTRLTSLESLNLRFNRLYFTRPRAEVLRRSGS